MAPIQNAAQWSTRPGRRKPNKGRRAARSFARRQCDGERGERAKRIKEGEGERAAAKVFLCPFSDAEREREAIFDQWQSRLPPSLSPLPAATGRTASISKTAFELDGIGCCCSAMRLWGPESLGKEYSSSSQLKLGILFLYAKW